MTNEEKKAVERIEETFYSDLGKGINKFQKITLYEEDIEDIRTILNLVEKQEKAMETLEDIKAFLTSIEEISSKVLSQKYVNNKDMKHSIYVINERVKYIQKMLDKVVDKQ